MNDSRTLARQSGFGFAGVLILLGIFGLLWNFNVLPDGFWGEFWTLWPLLLVAVGVNLVLSRRGAWLGSMAALAVVTGSLVAAWVLAVANPATSHSLSINSESISVKSDGAETARLELTVAAGDLSLTGGAPAGLLLSGGSQGSVAEVTDQRVSVRTSDGQRTVDVRLITERNFNFPPRRTSSPGRWVLRHAEGIPTDIRVETGASDLDLDLRELNVQSLNVDGGAADIDVVLPANAGRTTAEFSIGAADLDITVPAGVAARIDVESGISSINIDETRFPKQGDRYVSPDFESAANRVTIKIEAGVSDITIN
ncbi:MAG: toast rack family protein [Chloroflexi bacterium]|nr:toast rack family protein [Chloroflexota bacterium]